MGLGNGNPKEGNKGSNWRYEYQVLKGLTQIATNTSPIGGLATETTLLAVLTAIAGESEFETFIVIDTGNANAVLRVVYTWNTVTHTFDPPVYYDAAGAVVIPVGPLIFQDNSAVLANILIQDTAINGKLNNNYGVATGALRTASQIGNTTGQADFNAGITTSQTLRVVLPTDQTSIPVTLPSGTQALSSSLEVAATSGSVTIGAYSVSFTTDSTFTGTINGIARSANTTYNFTAQEGKTLPAISWAVTTGNMNIDKLV